MSYVLFDLDGFLNKVLRFTPSRIAKKRDSQKGNGNLSLNFLGDSGGPHGRFPLGKFVKVAPKNAVAKKK